MKKLFFASIMSAMALLGAGCTSSSESVSGQVEGHNYVDLGLPSGTMWATCNLGANIPEENGSYFAWGETDAKTIFEWNNYKWGNGEAESKIKMTKYCSHERKGEVDNKQLLEPADDAATTLWNGTWRTPTKEEWEELINGCDWEWVKNYKGKGFDMKKGISKTNGNTILFPFSGYYNGTTFYNNSNAFWTATQKADNGLDAYFVRMLTHNQNMNNGQRKQGMTIRAVTIKPAQENGAK